MATALNLFSARAAIVNEDRTGTPEFLRSLSTVMERIGGSSGTSGGIAPAIGGVVIAPFTMLPVASGGPVSRRWEYASTNPNTWNLGAGMMTFKGKFTSHDYFAANPVAHMPLGLRCDIAVLSTQPRFAGVAIGDLTGATEGCPWTPAVQIETRATGLDPGAPLRQLIPNAWTPRGKLLQDGIEYQIMIESKLIDSDRKTVRFVLSVYNSAHLCYDIIADTGDCLDPNTYLDYTQSGMAFASVFESNLMPWSVDWYDMTVTWGPATDCTTDATNRVDRYGAEVEGNLRFVGTGRRVKVYCTGATLDDWTAFQSQTTNGNTSVVAMPDGTATAANFLSTNNSSLTNFSFASYGMSGVRGLLECGGIGTGVTPPLDIKIGASVITTIKATGQDLAGDLTFTGTGRTVNVYCTGTTFSQWTAFKSQTANGNTSVLSVPNGTSTVANFLATNGSSLTNFSFLSVGTNGSNSLIESGGIGTGTNNPIQIKIGGTTHTFKTTGLRLSTGTEDLGLTTTRLTGLNNTGGAQALILTTGAQNLETYCTPGNIAAIAGAAVENVLRPAYGMISNIFADLRARGVL